VPLPLPSFPLRAIPLLSPLNSLAKGYPLLLPLPSFPIVFLCCGCSVSLGNERLTERPSLVLLRCYVLSARIRILISTPILLTITFPHFTGPSSIITILVIILSGSHACSQHTCPAECYKTGQSPRMKRGRHPGIVQATLRFNLSPTNSYLFPFYILRLSEFIRFCTGYGTQLRN
jgi:hypothetical protein